MTPASSCFIFVNKSSSSGLQVEDDGAEATGVGVGSACLGIGRDGVVWGVSGVICSASAEGLEGCETSVEDRVRIRESDEARMCSAGGVGGCALLGGTDLLTNGDKGEDGVTGMAIEERAKVGDKAGDVEELPSYWM